jgi:hypothetical protein
MMQEEYDEAGVEEGQGHDHSLVALHWGEHLVQKRVQVGKTTHKDCDSNQAA